MLGGGKRSGGKKNEGNVKSLFLANLVRFEIYIEDLKERKGRVEYKRGQLKPLS